MDLQGPFEASGLSKDQFDKLYHCQSSRLAIVKGDEICRLVLQGTIPFAELSERIKPLILTLKENHGQVSLHSMGCLLGLGQQDPNEVAETLLYLIRITIRRSSASRCQRCG